MAQDSQDAKLFKQAYLLAESGSAAEAFRIYMHLGQKMYPEAMHVLGDLFYRGEGITQSDAFARYWWWKAGVLGDEEAVSVCERVLGASSTSSLPSYLAECEHIGITDYARLHNLLMWAPLVSGDVTEGSDGMAYGLLVYSDTEEAISVATNLPNALERGIGVYFRSSAEEGAFEHVLRYGDLGMLELTGSVNAVYPHDIKWSEPDETLQVPFVCDREFSDSIAPLDYKEEYEPLFPFRSRELIKTMLLERGIEVPKFGLFDTKYGVFITFNVVEHAEKEGALEAVLENYGEPIKWHLPRAYPLLFLADELAGEPL